MMTMTMLAVALMAAMTAAQEAPAPAALLGNDELASLLGDVPAGMDGGEEAPAAVQANLEQEIRDLAPNAASIQSLPSEFDAATQRTALRPIDPHQCPKNPQQMVYQLRGLAKTAISQAYNLYYDCSYLKWIKIYQRKVQEVERYLELFLSVSVKKILFYHKEKIVGHLSRIPYLQELAAGHLLVCLGTHSANDGMHCLFNKQYGHNIDEINKVVSKTIGTTKGGIGYIVYKTHYYIKYLEFFRYGLSYLLTHVGKTEAEVPKLEKLCAYLPGTKAYKGPYKLYDQAYSLYAQADNIISSCYSYYGIRTAEADAGADAGGPGPEADAPEADAPEADAETGIVPPPAEADEDEEVPPADRE